MPENIYIYIQIHKCLQIYFNHASTFPGSAGYWWPAVDLPRNIYTNTKIEKHEEIWFQKCIQICKHIHFNQASTFPGSAGYWWPVAAQQWSRQGNCCCFFGLLNLPPSITGQTRNLLGFSLNPTPQCHHSSCSEMLKLRQLTQCPQLM